MNLNKFIKDKDFVHTCPFCNEKLAISNNPQYKANSFKGYTCEHCYIPNVKTISSSPYSQYNRGVVETVDFGWENIAEQVIITETFYLHLEGEHWYIVHNNLSKEQTTIVLAKPATQEHFPYQDEKPAGMVYVSDIAFLPLVDSWELSDQAETLNKIKTYLLFI